MATTTPESRARLAYTAYGKAVGFRSYTGEPMPSFDDLPARIRNGWQESTRIIWELATTGKAAL